MTVAGACLAVLVPFGMVTQERAPSGRVYDELLPFVGLQGVRLTIRGLGPSFWHVVGTAGDPETETTGLSRMQHEAIERSLWAVSKGELQRYGVTFLERPDLAERKPELAVDVSWLYERAGDRFVVRVEVSLLEEAALVKDPTRMVWVPTWAVTGTAFATRATLPTVIEGFVRNYLREFGELYRRARPSSEGVNGAPTGRRTSG